MAPSSHIILYYCMLQVVLPRAGLCSEGGCPFWAVHAMAAPPFKFCISLRPVAAWQAVLQAAMRMRKCSHAYR